MRKKNAFLALFGAAIAIALLAACAVPQGVGTQSTPADPAGVTPDYSLILQAAQDFYTAQNQSGNKISYGDAVKDVFSRFFRENYHADYSQYVTLEVKSYDPLIANSESGGGSAVKGVASRSIASPVYSVYMGMEMGEVTYLYYDIGRIIVRPLFNGISVLTYVQYYSFANTQSQFDPISSWSDSDCESLRTKIGVKGQTAVNDPYFYTHFTPAMLPAGMSDTLKCWYAGSILNVFDQDVTKTRSAKNLAYALITMPGNIPSSDIPEISLIGYYIYWGNYDTYYFERVYTW